MIDAFRYAAGIRFAPRTFSLLGAVAESGRGPRPDAGDPRARTSRQPA